MPVEGGGELLVTPVESTQPELGHLVYWAEGLSTVYLEGALHRARNAVTVRVQTREEPLSDAPAQRVTTVVTSPVNPIPEPVMDPFDVGARNLDVLRHEVSALNRPRLENIIDAYDLNPGGEDLSDLSDSQVRHFIVVAVDTQLRMRVQ